MRVCACVYRHMCVPVCGHERVPSLRCITQPCVCISMSCLSVYMCVNVCVHLPGERRVLDLPQRQGLASRQRQFPHWLSRSFLGPFTPSFPCGRWAPG